MDDCPTGLAAAMADIRRGDEAVAANRWPEAARAFHAADARLRKLEDHCDADIAERAVATIDELLVKKAAVDAAMPQAGCVPALNDARSLDAAALVAARGQDGAAIDHAFAQAEAAWAEAAALCAGSEQRRAEDGKAAAVTGREQARRRLAETAVPVITPTRTPETRTAAPAQSPPSPVEAPPAAAVTVEPPPSVPAPPAAAAPADAPAAPAVVPVAGPARVAEVPSKPVASPLPEASRGGDAAPADAAARPSLGQTLSGAAAKAASFLDRAVTGAATALGLPVEIPTGSGDTLRVGTTLYTGDFRRDPGGTVSGRGRVEWNNGDVFDGTLVRGKAEGRGAMSWRKTGSRYEGDWRNDLQNGRGTMVFGDGTRYEGDFVDGHLTGRGRYDYVGIGEHYEGDVADGKPHGRGTYTWKSGDRYEGEWRDGRKHGQGRYAWTDGSYWEGEYRDDERTENGRTVFPIQGR